MDWFKAIDGYCERTGPDFWSEPLNAASNAAFLIAAVAAARGAVRPGSAPDVTVLALSALVAVIGIGSFLFHTFANRWSLIADVVPIAIFILAYLFVAMRRYFGLSPLGAGAVTLAFFLGSRLFEAALPYKFLNGSGGYLPAWAALLAVGAVLQARGDPAGGRILAAALVFTASLAFRSLDHAVCEALPIGVHYMWHVLNALTLYILLQAALRSGPAPRALPRRLPG